MQVIAGKFKGQKIKKIASKDVRPTRNIIREAIFSSLSSGKYLKNEKPIIIGAIVADIFTGTGALAIEAMSRGAQHVYLVDKNFEFLEIAKGNIQNICPPGDFTLIRADAADLPKIKMQCDIIILDAPYEQGLTQRAINSIIKNKWLSHGGLIIVELAKREDLNLDKDLLEEIDVKIYGNSKLIYLIGKT